MTLQDAARIIGILNFAYPDTMRGMPDDERVTYIKTWHSFFAEDSAEEVLAAVQRIIAGSTDRFAPNVGMIREQMRKNRSRDPMSETEAWAMISKALENGIYGAEEEYKKLPPNLQRLVGSPFQLREWSMMETETVQSVVASNFQRSYRAIVKREEEWARLPENVRTALDQITGRVFGTMPALEEGQDDV